MRKRRDQLLDFLRKEGIKLRAPDQTHIEIPHVGTLTYYNSWFVPDEEKKRKYNLSTSSYNLYEHLLLEDLKGTLPASSQIPTLAEDNLIIAYTHQFTRIKLDSPEYGPVAFWGRKDSNNENRYERLLFKTRKFGNIELRLLTDKEHYTDTQLKDFEKATQADFERALEEQGLDSRNYNFDRGVLATVLERGEEVGRTYIATGETALVLHRKFGTPLVTKDHQPFSTQKVDLVASCFPEDFHGLELELDRFYDSSRVIEEIDEDFPELQIIRTRISYKVEPRDAIGGDRIRPYQKGFYVVKNKPQ